MSHVCTCLTMLGIVLGILMAGQIFAFMGSSFKFVYSIGSIFAAFGVSTLIGVAFGYLPVRSAAQLDSVVALARE